MVTPCHDRQLPPLGGGEECVWNFADVEVRGKRRYNFFITRWRLDASGENIDQVSSEFGDALEDKGGVIRASKERTIKTRQEVEALSWAVVDAHLSAHVKDSTFLLILNSNFADSLPRPTLGAILWFPQAGVSVNVLRSALGWLARATIDEQRDLFRELHTLAETQRREGTATPRTSPYGDLQSAVELGALLPEP
jgi:hypothetical protein